MNPVVPHSLDLQAPSGKIARCKVSNHSINCGDSAAHGFMWEFDHVVMNDDQISSISSSVQPILGRPFSL